MLSLADRLGCDRLATGHYARIAETDDPEGPLLRCASDLAKDQTYMLAALSPTSLARMRFPLGQLTKPQVRSLARAAELPVASAADSQDLCFLAGTDRPRFLARHGDLGDHPGPIVARDGKVLGRHLGQHRFTVGQRKGLGLSGEAPLYVLDKNADTNTVIAGPRHELRTSRVRLRSMHLRRTGARVDRVKLRYRSVPLPARLLEDPPAGRHPYGTLLLGEPVDGAAPGQIACLLDGELVVGWATITR
jgi:tRNA-specific 2-thiouridylase